MPFFFGCLWRESWLLATLLRALASVSNVAVSLETDKQINSEKMLLYLYTARVQLLSGVFLPSHRASLCEEAGSVWVMRT